MVDELFNNIQIIDLNKEISEFVIEIRKNKIKKIKLPDAIILATSKFLDIPLLTADWDDFLSIDETIIIKNLDSLKK